MYVYILKCRDGSYYTGVTNDLDRRVHEHIHGVDRTCYTYTRRPVELMFYEEFSDPNQAIAAEKQIKGWSRKKKEALIQRNWKRLKELAQCKNETSHRNFMRDKKDSRFNSPPTNAFSPELVEGSGQAAQRD